MGGAPSRLRQTELIESCMILRNRNVSAAGIMLQAWCPPLLPPHSCAPDRILHLSTICSRQGGGARGLGCDATAAEALATLVHVIVSCPRPPPYCLLFAVAGCLAACNCSKGCICYSTLFVCVLHADAVRTHRRAHTVLNPLPLILQLEHGSGLAMGPDCDATLTNCELHSLTNPSYFFTNQCHFISTA